MTGKIFDIHVHIPDPSTLPLFIEKGKKRTLMRLLLRKMGARKEKATSEMIESYNSKVLEWINESILNRAVLLALDGTYDENGHELARADIPVCTNDYIIELSRLSKKTLFAASIHPYRKDALRELEKCINNGACLIKWIPSAQNIDPENDKCLRFYDMIAAYKVPLLCHSGNEHTLAGKRNDFNNPERLIPALRRGVTVIAAHCGARMFLHEKSYFDSWSRLALKYDNCYGDISALVLSTRLHLVRRLTSDRRLASKVLYGSDFPTFPDLWSCMFRIGIGKTMELRRDRNPFNGPLKAFRELGMPDEVFTRAGSLLRIPDSPEKNI